MTNTYLRKPERRFTLWKWIIFGSLFLLIVNYFSSLTDNIKVAVVSIGLGSMITVQMIGMKKLSRGLKLLSGIGLSLLISSIASICLIGFCFVLPSSNLCVPSHLRTYIFGNYSFPLIIVAIWVVFEILGAVGKTIGYALRYRKK